MSKTLNRHAVARHLDRAVLTGGLSPELSAACEALVAACDANKPGIGGLVQKLVSDAWTLTARTAASAVKPADQRSALAGLRAVAELEEKLGLAPAEQATEAPDDDAVAEVAPVSAPAPAWSAR
jgi:hypothetical protein